MCKGPGELGLRHVEGVKTGMVSRPENRRSSGRRR